MSNIMLITSGKGGTGKSTVAVNLACSLSKLNKKTVVIELDSGLRCIDLMLNVDNVVYDLADLINGNCSASQALISVEGYDELKIIAAPADSNFALEETRFVKLCEFLSNKFDFVIIDTPAGIGSTLINALKAVKTGIIVTNPSQVSTRDAEKAAEILNKANIKETYLVINRVDLDIKNKSEIPNLDMIIDQIGAQLIAVIPEDKLLKKSVNQRTKKDLKKNIALKAFDNMAQRLLGKDISLLIQ